MAFADGGIRQHVVDDEIHEFLEQLHAKVVSCSFGTQPKPPLDFLTEAACRHRFYAFPIVDREIEQIIHVAAEIGIRANTVVRLI